MYHTHTPPEPPPTAVYRVDDFSVSVCCFGCCFCFVVYVNVKIVGGFS